MNASDVINAADVIVIKVGTALITNQTGDDVRQRWVDSLAIDIGQLRKEGKKIVIVSSGGVALGRAALNIPFNVPPETIRLEQKQAASSIGQFHVFQGYHLAFNQLGIKTAQVLLTMSETENRRMHLNARATLHTLIENDVIPIINENDTISTEEIRFGDNDRLAARVAQMIEADTVILLSTVDGLYTADPRLEDDAEHIPVVKNITDDHTKMAGKAIPGLSTGGMKSKLDAALAATRAGISLIITHGMENSPISSLRKDARHTLFEAHENTGGARKIWIQNHMSPKGAVIIDDGAIEALQNGKSLLPIGVKQVEGKFERGDAIAIKIGPDRKIGTGLSGFGAEDARKVIGKQSSEIEKILGFAGRTELIHRNDMVLDD